MSEINLNSILFDIQITKESILKLVTQEEIYSYYIGFDINNIISTVINSPFRADNVPSFSLYYHRAEKQTLMFFDFATKDCGDFIIFVTKLYGISYSKALLKIAYDLKLTNFNIDNNIKIQITNIEKIKEKKLIDVGINKREWLQKDKLFWQQFGITKSTLELYNVIPIKFIFYNGVAVKAESLAYAYCEKKDNIISYKIYQPLTKNKKYKWINNANYTVHQGYTQLPKKGNLLIITKSLKDVMSMRDVMNISAIGLQSESVTMKDSVMEEYKSRFKKVICLFDNDKAGIKLSELFASKYNIPYFLLPELPNVTDFSDLVKYGGNNVATSIFKESLNKIK